MKGWAVATATIVVAIGGSLAIGALLRHFLGEEALGLIAVCSVLWGFFTSAVLTGFLMRAYRKRCEVLERGNGP